MGGTARPPGAGSSAAGQPAQGRAWFGPKRRSAARRRARSALASTQAGAGGPLGAGGRPPRGGRSRTRGPKRRRALLASTPAGAAGPPSARTTVRRRPWPRLATAGAAGHPRRTRLPHAGAGASSHRCGGHGEPRRGRSLDPGQVRARSAMTSMPVNRCSVTDVALGPHHGRCSTRHGVSEAWAWRSARPNSLTRGSNRGAGGHTPWRRRLGMGRLGFHTP
jgi:hypothetical protein